MNCSNIRKSPSKSTMANEVGGFGFVISIHCFQYIHEARTT